MEIDFPLGLEGTDELPYSKRGLSNCWNRDGKIIQRPGINTLNTNSRVSRGAFVWNGSLYTVASQELLRIDDVTTMSFTSIGTISGTSNIRTAKDFNTTVILVPGGNIYTLDTSDTLTDISGNSNFVPCRSLVALNSRIIYLPSDGSPAFFSDVNAAGTVQASSFFDAEQLPDDNTETFQINNILYIGGTDSAQSFVDTGADPVPYRAQTGRTDVGIISQTIETQDDRSGQSAAAYFGKKKEEAPGIFIQAAGTVTKISNTYIDSLLVNYTTTQLEEAILGRFVWKGDDVLYFVLPDDAFGFFKGNWHTLDTLINGVDVPWQVGFVQEYNLKYYSFYTENMGVLEDINTDSGNAFRRVILGGQEIDGNASLQNIHYHMSQGFNDDVGSVYLELSDDNLVFYQPYAEETGVKGNYKYELEWNYPGGAYFQRFIGYRISTGENVNFSGTKLYGDTR